MSKSAKIPSNTGFREMHGPTARQLGRIFPSKAASPEKVATAVPI